MSTRFTRASHRSQVPFRRQRSQNERRGRTLVVERLESRLALDAAGLSAIAASELTLSFVPDGTDVAGQTSGLFADRELQQIPGWQDIVTRAFQTWADLVHVPVRVVADSGDRLGTLGAVQGDSRFGDVRIAGVPLPSDTFAMSVPYSDLVSGTWAGDLILGTNAPIDSAADLYSVALHEAGHVFGLGHSSDPSSPMYFHGISPVTSPTARDVSNLRDLLGLSADQSGTHSGNDEEDDDENDPDEHDQNEDDHNEDDHDEDEGNDRDAEDDDQLSRVGQSALDDSSSLMGNLLRGNLFRAAGELTSHFDVDVISLSPQRSVDSDADVLTVRLQVTDLEGFVPTVTLMTRDGKTLNTELLSNAGGLLVVQARGVDPRNAYAIKVGVENGPGRFNSGRYELEAHYSDRRTALADLYSGQLTSETSTIQQTLTVRETGLVHFVLSVDATEASSAAAVWVTISDQAGNVVQQIAATPGATRSAPEVLLPAGEYNLSFSAGDAQGNPLSALRFTLRGKGVSLPIGPRLVDPIRSPALPSAGSSGGVRPSRPVDNLVVSPVIYPVTGAVTAPPKPIQVQPPWNDPNWWYWSTTIVVAAP